MDKQRACFDVSTGFGGSPESGSVPERSVLCSSGATGRAAEPQVDINTLCGLACFNKCALTDPLEQH